MAYSSSFYTPFRLARLIQEFVRPQIIRLLAAVYLQPHTSVKPTKSSCSLEPRRSKCTILTMTPTMSLSGSPHLADSWISPPQRPRASTTFSPTICKPLSSLGPAMKMAGRSHYMTSPSKSVTTSCQHLSLSLAAQCLGNTSIQ